MDFGSSAFYFERENVGKKSNYLLNLFSRCIRGTHDVSVEREKEKGVR
jgi:hypothetical protein